MTELTPERLAELKAEADCADATDCLAAVSTTHLRALIAAAEERDDFAEQLALRTPTAQDADMQEIMRINNDLRALLVRAGEAMKSIETIARNYGNWPDWKSPPNYDLTMRHFRLFAELASEIRRATQGETG